MRNCLKKNLAAKGSCEIKHSNYQRKLQSIKWEYGSQQVTCWVQHSQFFRE